MCEWELDVVLYTTVRLLCLRVTQEYMYCIGAEREEAEESDEDVAAARRRRHTLGLVRCGGRWGPCELSQVAVEETGTGPGGGLCLGRPGLASLCIEDGQSCLVTFSPSHPIRSQTTVARTPHTVP